MKKIAIITNWHPYSGGGKYAFNIFDRLRNSNLIYFEYGSNRIADRNGVIKVRKSLFNGIDKTLMTYYYFPKHIPDGFDLYHATNQFLANVAKHKKPCVITHMDLIPMLFPKGKFAPIGVFLKRLIKNYKHAEHIICLSEVVKNELLEFIDIPEEKISIIYPGVDEKLYKPIRKHTAREVLNLPIDKKIILNVGSEEPDKGVPLLLDYVSALHGWGEDVVLVRIGSSNPKFNKFKKELGVLQFSGIPEEQMPLFYSAADLFVAPFNYGAGFVYPPLEAISCGTPALVSNLDFPGYVNVPRKMFSSMLCNLLDDKKFRKNMGDKGLKEAQNYTLTKEIKEILKVYKKVL